MKAPTPTRMPSTGIASSIATFSVRIRRNRCEQTRATRAEARKTSGRPGSGTASGHSLGTVISAAATTAGVSARQAAPAAQPAFQEPEIKTDAVEFDNAANTLRVHCVDGITANADTCRHYVNYSIGTVTALNPVLGYDNATELAAEAYKSGKGILEVIREKKILDEKQIADLLDPVKLSNLHRIKYENE